MCLITIPACQRLVQGAWQCRAHMSEPAHPRRHRPLRQGAFANPAHANVGNQILAKRAKLECFALCSERHSEGVEGGQRLVHFHVPLKTSESFRFMPYKCLLTYICVHGLHFPMGMPKWRVLLMEKILHHLTVTCQGPSCSQINIERCDVQLFAQAPMSKILHHLTSYPTLNGGHRGAIDSFVRYGHEAGVVQDFVHQPNKCCLVYMLCLQTRQCEIDMMCC